VSEEKREEKSKEKRRRRVHVVLSTTRIHVEMCVGGEERGEEQGEEKEKSTR